jgi:hypothetical protein
MVSTNLCNPNRPGPSGSVNQRFRIGVFSGLAIRAEYSSSGVRFTGLSREKKRQEKLQRAIFPGLRSHPK